MDTSGGNIMRFTLILGIIFLALLIGIIVYVKNKIERFSQSVLGTKSLVEGFQKIEKEYVETPKSVSGMTRLFLPNIMKDFPEFHYEEMRERAEHVLTAYLLSIHNRKSQLPDYVNSDLVHQLEMQLQMLSNKNQKAYFNGIKIHQCELSNYTTIKGKCCITFQASVQYYHYVEDDMHQVVLGKKEVYTQSRYNIDMIYIQNRDLVEDAPEDVFGLNCPNCGAAITRLGQKHCEYCGSGIIELNIHAWTFSDVRES